MVRECERERVCGFASHSSSLLFGVALGSCLSLSWDVVGERDEALERAARESLGSFFEARRHARRQAGRLAGRHAGTTLDIAVQLGGALSRSLCVNDDGTITKRVSLVLLSVSIGSLSLLVIELMLDGETH